MPYYTKDELKSSEIIKSHLQNIALSGNVNALSFPYYLYDFIKSLNLKNASGKDIDLLTWNEGQSWKEQSYSHKAFDDEQIKVILAGEKGEYR